MRLTFEIKEMAFSSSDSLALTNDDSLEHLLSELGLTLLDGGKEHVTDGTSGEAIELGTDASASDHVQILGSSVIGAVHDRSDWQRVGNLQLDTVASSSCYTLK